MKIPRHEEELQSERVQNASGCRLARSDDESEIVEMDHDIVDMWLGEMYVEGISQATRVVMEFQ